MAEQSPLTWEQLLLLVRQLPEEDQEKLAYQVLKDRGQAEFSSLVHEITEQIELKDLPSVDSILKWMDDFRKGPDSSGKAEGGSGKKP